MRTLIFLIVFSQLTFAQKSTNDVRPTRILFVFDASKSMMARYGQATRMDGAKNLFYRFIDSLGQDKNIQFALRMYGSTVKYPPGDCRDSKLVVPFSQGNQTLIKEKVSQAKPTGITPIEHSLTEAANDFKDNKSNNIVIIITDGIEECGGDPCKARQKLMEKGIIFKPFIIGIGLSPEQIKTFECVGTYLSMEDEKTFSSITGIIQQQSMSKTTVQVNLLNKSGVPKETDVNMTFSDVQKKQYRYNYIHTLNHAGLPDTLYIDDYPLYEVTAHTIPPVKSAETRLSAGKHNIIAIDAPQGFIQIRRNEGPYNFNTRIKCLVRETNEMQTLHVQPVNTTEKYITGAYDIEVTTLPRTYIERNSVEQSKTVSVNIQSAGQLMLRAPGAGDGCILINRQGRLDFVCNLGPQLVQTFQLQPGSYVVTWRAKALKGSIYTVEKKFSIQQDTQTIVELYK